MWIHVEENAVKVNVNFSHFTFISVWIHIYSNWSSHLSDIILYWIGDQSYIYIYICVCIGVLLFSNKTGCAGNEKKLAHLWKLEGAKERLQLVRASLMEEGSFDDAIMGCHGVFHTASPVLKPSSDPKACSFFFVFVFVFFFLVYAF